MTTNKPEVFEVYRTRQGTLENVVLLADYEALQAECEKLRKDAERYRWLREQCQKPVGGLTIATAGTWELGPWSGDDPDEAIDRARRIEGES